ncbi:hypothetical protein SAMN06296386_102265 [Lachnospiraceae bacterium]|nr:hypothetical protein SAMN06296386_102265 [Lachnospiraceae bacterium]
MIRLGELQKLYIERFTDFGAYLTDAAETASDEKHEGDKNEILLPKKQIPEFAEIGDPIKVFIYRDSSDRLISTVNKPYLLLHQAAVLKCRDVNKVGAFLDMGLERDLLLPYHEQTYKVKEGDEVLVAMYIDKSDRLAATMKVYEYLSTDHSYKANDEVEGVVYQISRNFGAFVAVDNKYSGLVPAREFNGEAKPGDIVRARVTGVKEDGKLDLSLKKKAYLQLDDDGEKILDLLKENGGEFPFTDKADPEKIREVCQMSKGAFKRAVGHLMKRGLVSITEEKIVLLKK